MSTIFMVLGGLVFLGYLIGYIFFRGILAEQATKGRWRLLQEIAALLWLPLVIIAGVLILAVSLVVIFLLIFVGLPIYAGYAAYQVGRDFMQPLPPPPPREESYPDFPL